MLVGDEEIGSFNGSKPLVREHQEKNGGFDYAIVGEPTDLDIQVGTRGVLWLNVLLEGEGVHASRAHMAKINVMDELSKALERLNNISLTYKSKGALPSPSSEITRVKTTETYNSVPGQVEIGLDVRYLPSQTIEGIVEELEEALDGLDCGVRVEVEQDHGGAFKLSDEKFKKVATQVLEDLTEKEPDYITEGGASDGRFFSRHGTPFIELGLIRISSC
jgi:Acetylornithine deacetylase/Succinyl-diaminopimelate desuccinylase and related deacylases